MITQPKFWTTGSGVKRVAKIARIRENMFASFAEFLSCPEVSELLKIAFLETKTKIKKIKAPYMNLRKTMLESLEPMKISRTSLVAAETNGIKSKLNSNNMPKVPLFIEDF